MTHVDQAGRSLVKILFAAALVSGLVAAAWVLSDQAALVWTNRDFSNYWIASRLFLDGRVLDLFRGHDIYFAHMLDAFGPDYPWHSWSYPPHFVLMIWPLAYLPLGISMVVFLMVTLVLYLHAVWLLARRYTDYPALALVPFVICNFVAAQNGFLTASLLLYGLLLRDSRPLLSGVAIGLLTVKPQLGILLPVLLVFERRWLIIVVAALTSACMVALSVLVLGSEAWAGYLGLTWAYQRHVMNDFTGAFLAMMPSVFGSVRYLGYPSHTAMLWHLPVAMISFGIFIWTLFRFRSTEARAASLAFATFMISPYSLTYDLGGLVALSVLACLPVREPRRLANTFVVLTVATMPLLDAVSFHLVEVPVMPFVLTAGWGMLIFHQARQGSGGDCSANARTVPQ